MWVAFFGHRNVEQPEAVKQWLRAVVDNLISAGVENFYLGGYGDFDRLAAAVIREQKVSHPQLQMILVLPYLHSGQDTFGYDATIFPPLETVPPRYAISTRNRWIIAASDIVVAYVVRGWGGAAKSVAYAQKKQKTLLLFPKLQPIANREQLHKSDFCGDSTKSTDFVKKRNGKQSG